MEILAFGRRDEEREQPVVGYQRAHGMDAWSSVAPDGREKGEADAVLVHERAAGDGQLGLDLPQLAPAKPLRHPMSLAERSRILALLATLERVSRICRALVDTDTARQLVVAVHAVHTL